MTTTDQPKGEAEGEIQQKVRARSAQERSQGEGEGGVAAQPSLPPAPPPLPAPPAPPAPPGPGPPPPGLRLHQAVVILGSMAQAAVTASQWGASSASGCLQTATILAALVSLACVTLAAPRFYWRHRVLLQSAARIGLYTIPSFRQVGVGTALMLERPPRPGWRGAAADLARVICGTRLLGLAVGGAVIPLPPALMLVTQLVLLRLIANSQGYCGTQLLSHPLMQGRAAQLAARIECGTLPVLLLLVFMEPDGMAVSAPPAAGPPAATHQTPGSAFCCATLLFLQLALGVLLPTLLAAYNCTPPAAAAVPGQAEAGGSSTSVAAMTLPSSHGASTAHWPNSGAALAIWKKAAGAALRASAAADQALHVALQSESTVGARAAAAWFLLALCWALSKRLAGLPRLL